MESKRFKITLNWYGEVSIHWKHTKSKAQARALAIKELSEKLGKEPFSMLAYFNGSKDNILIVES